VWPSVAGTFLGRKKTYSDNTGGKQDTASPAQVDVGGKISTELNRADLGCISSRKSLEDTP